MAIAEICEMKQRQRIVPALATEIELQQAMMRQGVTFTAASYKKMLRELEADSQVVTRRLLMYNGYELLKDADYTENNS